MIFLAAFFFACIYGLIKLAFDLSGKTALWVIGAPVFLLCLCADLSGETGGVLTGLGVMVVVIMVVLFRDAEETVNDKDKLDKAIKSQQKQEEYDNKWGYIHKSK